MPSGTISPTRQGGAAEIGLKLHDIGDRNDPVGKRNRFQATRELPQAKAEMDRRLDQALEQTFPASDPISVMICL